MARFEAKEDLDRVLREGPWQLEFSVSNANHSQVAMWVRFPRLPIEFYDTVVLKKIGFSIGPMLCIDSHTIANARGRYARLYVKLI